MGYSPLQLQHMGYRADVLSILGHIPILGWNLQDPPSTSYAALVV